MPKLQHDYTHGRSICWQEGTWHQAEEPGVVLGVFVSFVYCRPFPVLPVQTHWMFAVVAEPPTASFATAGTGRAAELPWLQAATLPRGWLLAVCEWQLSCSLRPVTATSPRAWMCELERAEGPQDQKRKQREEYSIISLIRISSWHVTMAPHYRIGFKILLSNSALQPVSKQHEHKRRPAGARCPWKPCSEQQPEEPHWQRKAMAPHLLVPKPGTLTRPCRFDPDQALASLGGLEQPQHSVHHLSWLCTHTSCMSGRLLLRRGAGWLISYTSMSQELRA